jgi:hypothetical protein
MQSYHPVFRMILQKKEITIECGAANLTEIDNQLKDSTILHKETQDSIWLLNAGLVVSEDVTLY